MRPSGKVVTRNGRQAVESDGADVLAAVSRPHLPFVSRRYRGAEDLSPKHSVKSGTTFAQWAAAGAGAVATPRSHSWHMMADLAASERVRTAAALQRQVWEAGADGYALAVSCPLFQVRPKASWQTPPSPRRQVAERARTAATESMIAATRTKINTALLGAAGGTAGDRCSPLEPTSPSWAGPNAG